MLIGPLLPDGCSPMHSIMPPEMRPDPPSNITIVGPSIYMSYANAVSWSAGFYTEIDETVAGSRIFEIWATDQNFTLDGEMDVCEKDGWELVGGTSARLSEAMTYKRVGLFCFLFKHS